LDLLKKKIENGVILLQVFVRWLIGLVQGLALESLR